VRLERQERKGRAKTRIDVEEDTDCASHRCPAAVSSKKEVADFSIRSREPACAGTFDWRFIRNEVLCSDQDTEEGSGQWGEFQS